MSTRLSQFGGRTYLQLVKAYRNEHSALRQRVVSTFERHDQMAPENPDPLIGGLLLAIDQTPSADAPPVVFDSTRPIGDLYALYALWSQLCRMLHCAPGCAPHNVNSEPPP